MSDQTFDFIVVGAGSAGCVVAARLAESGAGTVLLIEAGEPAERNPESLSADGFKYAFAKDALMWHRMTAPQKDCGGRSLYAGTGRGMGGSGAVNGMVYTRGEVRDYENWPQGWRWDDLVPSFEAVERCIGVRPRAPTPFAQRFIDAAVGAGFRRKDGLNDGDLGGFVGCNDMNYEGTERRSAYRAWLHGRSIPNLEILTGASVRRIVFDSDTASAVECESDGVIQRIGVRGELVLCAGALETPRLLLLSGVGPRAQLEGLGISVVVDAPGVGRNLHDHPNACLFYRGRARVDFEYPQLYAFEAVGSAGRAPDSPPNACFVCYAVPASIKESTQRMLPILALPGKLYGLRPLRTLLRALVSFAFALPPLKRLVSGMFGIVVILGKPTSRGEIRLVSSDPATPPHIDPAYYATAEDRALMLAAIARAREIAAQPPLSEVGARPLSVGGKPVSRDRVWKWITAATMTTFHFCGSCRMGADADSPLDTRLRVKGLRNVRVADASAMPETPVSALNAPSMMIGYRAADFVLAARDSARATARAEAPAGVSA